MKLKIEITMDNAAFEDNGAECARILRKLSNDLDDLDESVLAPGQEVRLLDVNGNHVGEAKVVR